MALQRSFTALPRHAAAGFRLGFKSTGCLEQRRGMATPVPPVSQDRTGSKGPTAMVFLNMGGPSTTDEVGDFLSRLFVSLVFRYRIISCARFLLLTFGIYVGGRRFDSSRPSPIISWSPHFETAHTKDPEAVCRYWRRISHPKVV
jgi:hypothetical protein